MAKLQSFTRNGRASLILGSTLLGLTISVFSGCNNKEDWPTVSIYYKQLASFTEFRYDNPSGHYEIDNGVGVLFEIVRIENNDNGAKPFKFEKKKMHAALKGAVSNAGLPNPVGLLGTRLIHDQVIPARETLVFSPGKPRCLIKKVDEINVDPNIAGGGPKVTMYHQVKDYDNEAIVKTHRIETTPSALHPATPETLQAKCDISD